MKTRIASTIASIGLAIACSLALADDAATTKADSTVKSHGDWSHHHKSAMTMSDRTEARLAYVKTALKITEAQKTQWDAYADFERKQAKEMEAKFEEWKSKEHGKKEKGDDGMYDHTRMSVISRLEHEREFMADAQTRIDAKLAVIKPLYGVLSETQKKVADEVLSDCGHHHGWGHGRHHHNG